MKIKKAFAGLSFVALMAVGGTVFAAGPMEHKTVSQEDGMTMTEEDCMIMNKKDCMEMMKDGMSKDDCKTMSKKDCMEMMKNMKK